MASILEVIKEREEKIVDASDAIDLAKRFSRDVIDALIN